MYKISEKATLLFSYVNQAVTYLPHLEDGRDDPAVEILEAESGRDGGSTGRVFMSDRKASNLKHREQVFISPPNVYMSNTGLVLGITGGYTARWCQRAV